MSEKGHIPSSSSSTPSGGNGEGMSRPDTGGNGRLPSSTPFTEEADDSRGAPTATTQADPESTNSQRERIRRTTAGGRMDQIPPGFGDPDDGDWRVVESENPFTVLYLDHEQHQNITDEVVQQHYDLLRDFWKQKVEGIESGAGGVPRQIARLYGGGDKGTVRARLDKTNRAYSLLNDAEGREMCHRELSRARRERGREKLLPLLEGLLRDDVLEPSETKWLFEQGSEAGLREKEVAEMTGRELRDRGFGPAREPEGDMFAQRLRSVRWITEKKHRWLRKKSEEAAVGPSVAAGGAGVSPSDRSSPGKPPAGEAEQAPNREAEQSSWLDNPQARQRAMMGGGVLLVLILLVGGVALYGSGSSKGGDSSGDLKPPFPSKLLVKIDTERLNVRDKPTAKNSDVLTTVEEGEQFEVLDTRDGWQQVRVRTDGGQRRTGWIYADYTKRVDGKNADEQPGAYEQEHAAPRASRRITTEKRRFRSEMTAQLDAFARQLARLEQQAGRAQEEPRKELEAKIDELKDGRNALENELAKLSDLSASQLPSFKAGLFEGESSLRRRIERIQDEASAAVTEARTASGKERDLSLARNSASNDGTNEDAEAERSRTETPNVSDLGGETDNSRKEADDTPVRHSFGSGMSATGEINGSRFKVTVLGGTATRTLDSGTKLELEVRQKSVNFDGKWVRWGHILKESYLMTGGRRYEVKRAASDNLGGGRVRVGDTRTGTLIFQLDVPPSELNHLTLRFAYFPYRDVKSVRVSFSIQ